MPEIVDVPPADVRELLSDWRTEPAARDWLVQLAREAGVRVREICELSGLDRKTVRGILRCAS